MKTFEEFQKDEALKKQATYNDLTPEGRKIVDAAKKQIRAQNMTKLQIAAELYGKVHAVSDAPLGDQIHDLAMQRSRDKIKNMVKLIK